MHSGKYLNGTFKKKNKCEIFKFCENVILINGIKSNSNSSFCSCSFGGPLVAVRSWFTLPLSGIAVSKEILSMKWVGR